MRRGRKTIAVMSLIVMIIALVFVAYQLFRIRDISVVGNASSDYVISLSGIEVGQSVFFVDKEKVFEAIDKEPWLKMIEIKVNYPDKVVIVAEQREIAAYVDKDESLLAIDKDCVLLRVAAKEDTALPIIYGLQMDKFEVGKRLGAGDTFVLGVVQRVLQELSVSDIDAVGIDVSLAANIILHTRQGIIIQIGDDTQLASKFNLAILAMQEQQLRGKTQGILDVSSVTKAYYREN